MAFDYAELAQMALEMVEEFGRPISLIAPSETLVNEANPFEGTEGAETPDDIDAHEPIGVFTDFDLKSIDGVNVIAGDKRLVVAASDAPEDDAERERFTVIKDGSDLWQVQSCKKVQPGDTPIAYFFHVRLMPRSAE